MLDKVKKLDPKTIKNGVIFIGLFAVLIYVALPSEEDVVIAAPKKVNVTKKEINSQSQFANAPKRFSQAPDYNDGFMAAKIIKQAIDPEEAKHFVNLKMSERNLQLQNNIASLQAQIAENLASKAESENKMNSVGSGNEVNSSIDYEQGSYKTIDGVVSYGADGQVQNAPALENAIRLVGWSNGKISASLNGDEYASKIRENQVLWGRYKVTGIDDDLQCIQLKDMNKKRDIPNVCYN